LSNKDQINVEPALRYNDIEALKVIYEEKQISSWRLLAEAVTRAAVMHATDPKIAGESPFLVQ
jgi:hypothetical protein